MSTTPTREIVIEMIPNEEIYLLWTRLDYEFDENEDIYMVWNDNDTYRKD